jgi:nucleoside-diphosphate-sugar epimerase
VYNLGEPESVSHLGWAERFAAVMGWSGAIETREEQPDLPEGLDWSVPLEVDTRRIRDELGFAELLSAPERLARTVEAERRLLA